MKMKKVFLLSLLLLNFNSSKAEMVVDEAKVQRILAYRAAKTQNPNLTTVEFKATSQLYKKASEVSNSEDIPDFNAMLADYKPKKLTITDNTTPETVNKLNPETKRFLENELPFLVILPILYLFFSNLLFRFYNSCKVCLKFLPYINPIVYWCIILGLPCYYLVVSILL